MPQPLRQTLAHLATFSAEDWAIFHAYLHRLRETPSTSDDIVVTCDVCCNDPDYWAANGGAIAQWFACGVLGLDCPCYTGHGGA